MVKSERLSKRTNVEGERVRSVDLEKYIQQNE